MHAGIHEFWFGVFPLMVVMGLGMSLVVSPLSTAVMTALGDADSGIASGINNAVARVAGLIAVALMGGVAALVFQSALGGAGQGLSFGLPASGLPAERAAAAIDSSRALSSMMPPRRAESRSGDRLSWRCTSAPPARASASAFAAWSWSSA